MFLRRGVVSPVLNPKAGGPSVVDCPRLLIQYIRSRPPHLQAVTSIRSLRMSKQVRHAFGKSTVNT